MCDRCAVLEEEVSYLRERLGEQLNKDLVRVVMKAWGLSYGEASVVSVLYSAQGAIVNPWSIGDVVRQDHTRGYETNTVQVFIKRIRDKINREFITTFHGAGYALSAAAMAEIEAVR